MKKISRKVTSTKTQETLSKKNLQSTFCTPTASNSSSMIETQYLKNKEFDQHWKCNLKFQSNETAGVEFLTIAGDHLLFPTMLVKTYVYVSKIGFV